MKRWLSILIVVGLLQAGEFTKVANTTAQFLKLGVGARAMAMGGSFVALANDATALYWNPAGILSFDRPQLAVVHNRWVLDINHDFVGLAIPLNSANSFGLSLTALNMGEQEVTTINQPDGAGLYYDVSELAVGLHLAYRMTDRLSYGGTLKFIRSSAYNESAHTFAIDIGSLLRTDFYGMVLGMALVNFGGEMRYDGRDLLTKSDIDENLDGNYTATTKLTTESWPLPLTIRMGAGMNLLGSDPAPWRSHQLRVTVELSAEHPNDSRERVMLGVETAFREMVFLRGGYRWGYDLGTYSLGGGVCLELPGLGELHCDYAYLPLGVFSPTSYFSLDLSF